MSLILKIKILSSICIVPYILFNPLDNKFTVGWGGWGVDIWIKLVIILLGYILIYNYFFNVFWKYLENKTFMVFKYLYIILGNLDVNLTILIYLEDLFMILEYVTYHYFLYFLFIM